MRRRIKVLVKGKDGSRAFEAVAPSTNRLATDSVTVGFGGSSKPHGDVERVSLDRGGREESYSSAISSATSRVARQ